MISSQQSKIIRSNILHSSVDTGDVDELSNDGDLINVASLAMGVCG